MRGLRAQQLDDFGQPNSARRPAARRRPAPVERHAPVVLTERLRDLRHRKHEIDRAGRDRAARHAVIAGLVGILRDDQPAFLLHGLQPEAAVGAGARKDDADGARAVVLGQRVQQEVEGQARAVARLRLREMQGAVADGQIGSWRDDIDMFGSIGMPSVACSTVIDVWPASRSTIMLS